MNRIESATTFLEQAASGEVERAFSEFVSSDFIHHMPWFEGGRQTLMDQMMEAHKVSPNRAFEVKQAFEDGDSVITHSLVTRQNLEEQPIVAVHIFRFKRDKIAELWCVAHELPKDSPNQYGAF